MFAYFLKIDIFTKKKTFFFTTTQKTLFFCFFFEIFLFQFFHIVLFYFSNIKKTKNKKCSFFFENPLFDTLTNCQKIIFAPLHTIFVFFFFFDKQKNTIKLGEKQANKNLGRIFNATLDGFSTQKPPTLGRIFNSTAFPDYRSKYRLWANGVVRKWGRRFNRILPFRPCHSTGF